MTPEEASQLYTWLRDNISWQQLPITLFGKTHMQPRLIHYEGEKSYTYSGVKLNAVSWNAPIQNIRKRVMQLTGKHFNSALINYYRDGSDYMGWHSDNEASLGKKPIVPSVSLGAQRDMVFRRIDNPKTKFELALSSGSLLVMKETTQELWQHCLPRRKRVQHGRINITFRQIKE